MRSGYFISAPSFSSAWEHTTSNYRLSVSRPSIQGVGGSLYVEKNSFPWPTCVLSWFAPAYKVYLWERRKHEEAQRLNLVQKFETIPNPRWNMFVPVPSCHETFTERDSFRRSNCKLSHFSCFFFNFLSQRYILYAGAKRENARE